MLSYRQRDEWLNTAVSGICFTPDRDDARRELAGHIEDKIADLRRIFPDIPEEEAQARALAGMGDPEEVKSELAKVHHPWLGWLWMASRWLVRGVLAVGLALALLVFLDSLDDGPFSNIRYRYEEAQRHKAAFQALYGNGTPDWEGEQLAVYSVDAEARLGRATISVSNAARWREPEGECLYLQVRITWDRPWEANRMAAGFLWAEDDQGRRYSRNEPGTIRTQGWGSQGLFYRQENVRLEDFPPEAAQLRLHYMDGTDFDLVLDLSREVEP